MATCGVRGAGVERPVRQMVSTSSPGQDCRRIGVLRRVFQNAVERAKLPADLHQHDLRHRRVTTWLAGGADVAKVREAMGHADLRTTMGYTHLVRENLWSLVELVGRSWEDPAGKDAKGRDVAGAVGA
jgi:site-specific recombinase XerD